MPHHLIGFLIHYRYQVIFPIAVLEGPIITIVSGFLVSRGFLSFIPALLVVWSGDMVSDSFFYWLGRSGIRILKKLRFIKFPEARIAKLESHFKRHPGKTIALSKASYGVGSLFLVAAGASKMTYGKFLKYITLPNAVKALSLLTVGYFFGRAFRSFNGYLQYYAIAVVIVTPVAYYLFRRARKRAAATAAAQQ
jgi:membrane-associated protein